MKLPKNVPQKLLVIRVILPNGIGPSVTLVKVRYSRKEKYRRG